MSPEDATTVLERAGFHVTISPDRKDSARPLAPLPTPIRVEAAAYLRAR
jgi:hypothetical protein